MSILIYAESENKKLKKVAYEVASYAASIAEKTQDDVVAVTINAENTDSLGQYGVNKVLNVQNESLDKFNVESYSEILTKAVRETNADIVVLSQSDNAKYIAPLLSVVLKAGYASNVVELPETENGFQVKRNVFTNKAFGMAEVTTDKKIIGLSSNAFGLHEKETNVETVDFSPELSDTKIEVKSVDKNKDKVSIADAEIVVSGGRGLKGPENWGMIEELAEVLGAATACSKPVSDMGWRPHSEHVGQTGKPVVANLYIAIGISGAIQHLAGINASKTKVVINIDEEAPFFKVADYGIVGDAFEVVPRLTEKLKEFKANNA
ncbi:electron transfer flavoprotein subunit alpha/FixB family protein [Flavobacterium sp. CS20]|uniref:electron transfer flavoprotein subunit alpha/FixB family protein n=1 Tax=Flavobacterium sp. CS20 TaxID=2775246 RepID=UPI001B3A2ACF|nr:electron transfer flavoprotein subunit alpha/FixB family protein [Flavobacterium sp. CS20]QTY26779.1 electron transfer flavoprotein subunit alpha/FixB family protein [Flavobacterium sp. CS20]